MGNKVVITADWHVHNHGGDPRSLSECIKAARWTFDVARNRGAKWVVHAGDVFEDRRLLDIQAYQLVYDAIVDAANDGIRTCILLGNHDMFHLNRWDTSSIKPLQAAATVVMQPKSIEICGLRWDFMPYTDRPAEMLERYFPAHSRGDILVGHFGVAGAVMNGLYGRKFVSRVEADALHREMFFGWKRVFLGHFHKQQVLDCGNAEFVGSPLQLNFGEAGDSKSVVVLDVEADTAEYVKNDFSPRFIIANSIEELDGAGDISGCHLRIDLADKSQDVLSVRRRAESMFKLASCTVRPPKPNRQPVITECAVDETRARSVVSKSGLDPFIIANDHLEMARRYAEACAMSPALTEIGLEIIRSVRGSSE